TESGKQAVLAEISQLQSQNQVMDARRRAILDDIALSDRQERTAAGVRSRAADEQGLAESALLNATVEGRARGAEAQRGATLGKPAPAAPQPDYSGMRLWTTADAGGASSAGSPREPAGSRRSWAGSAGSSRDSAPFSRSGASS